MLLIGANMRGDKFVFGLCAGLSCSMIFSENDILWDFGVVINPPNYHNISKNNPVQSPSKLNKSQIKINAVISDPFVPPIKNTLTPKIIKSNNNLIPKIMSGLGSEKNIFQISSEAKIYYFKKNYGYVIELLQHKNLTHLTQKHRYDLEYLLAESLYKAGEYKKAQNQVLSLLNQNETERLCFLLAMIYEALGKNNKSKEYYLKLINQYPKSDYTVSAYIKSHILSRH